ncbi:MAG: DUF2752 domain-containing protein [Bacteroidota bacterium]
MKKVVLTVLLVAPIVLFFLPSDFFDQGTSLCPSKRLLNFECLGCGLTRGVMHLIHFDFETAWYFNKLSFIVVPVGLFFWGKNVVKVYRDLKMQV